MSQCLTTLAIEWLQALEFGTAPPHWCRLLALRDDKVRRYMGPPHRARAWIDRHADTFNLYWRAARCLPNSAGWNAPVHESLWAWADVDHTDASAADVARAAGDLLGAATPDYAWRTGGGVQLLWRTHPNMRRPEVVEDTVAGIAMALREGGMQADSVWDRGRLLRLPWTTNFPSQSKRARGRTETPTGGAIAIPRTASETERGQALLGLTARGAAVRGSRTGPRRLAKHKEGRPQTSKGAPERLESWVLGDDVALMVAHGAEGMGAEVPRKADGSPDRSRIAYLCLRNLLESGVSVEGVAALLTNPEYAGGDWYRRNGGRNRVHKDATRLLTRAKEHQQGGDST